MKIEELVDQIEKSDPELFENIPKERASELIRDVFRHIANTIASTEEGVVNYGGFGRFRVKKVARDVDGEQVVRTQIIFRMVDPSKRKERRRKKRAGKKEAG